MKREPGARSALYDSLFLAAIVVLSSLPYVGSLGLYSDDWAFLSALHTSDGTYLGLLASVMPMELATRPVQGLVLAGLYWLFGIDPLGYHLTNTAILTAAVLLFYHSLRLLGLPRVIAVAVPLVFGLLPHYSTDRFWIAAFQANVSVSLYFLSLYSDLRFVSRPSPAGWLWKAVAAVALVGSVLAYEVTALLLLVNVIVLVLFARARRGDDRVRRIGPTALGAAANVAFLLLTIGYKLTTTVRADVASGYRYRALRILTEAVPVHFGEYGVGMPIRVAQALREYPDGLVIATSLLIGTMVGGYILLILRGGGAARDRGVSWPGMIMAGGALFVAGYGVALMTWEIGFHTTGANNRTAIGATIGVAWVFVGAIGLLSSALPSERIRRLTFSSLVAILAASGALLTNTVALFWVRAAREQETIISRLQQQFPDLEPGSALLIDGICPFEGPAPVFATGWDTTGMLQLTYGDGSLRGDVVKPNTELTPAGVRTLLFDDVINVYPYGEALIVYNVRTGEAFSLPDRDAARDYMDAVSRPARPDCPPYTDGDGVPVF
jgi:hypothetical protein